MAAVVARRASRSAILVALPWRLLTLSPRELFVLSLIDLAVVLCAAGMSVLRVLTLLLLWCWFELLLLASVLAMAECSLDCW